MIGSLIDDPAFEARLWNEMRKMVVEVRAIPTLLIERRDVVEQVEATKTNPPIREAEFRNLNARRSAIEAKLESARKTKEALGGIVLHLSNLLDARAVRLIGPLLTEDNISHGSISGYKQSSIPVGAMTKLNDLERADVFESGIAQSDKYVVEEWRKWWSLHKAEFGAVYELPKANAAGEAQSTEQAQPRERNVLNQAKPLASQDSRKDVGVGVVERPVEGSSIARFNWYWGVPAACVALIAGLFAVFRRKT